jgi:hypothetical protein
MSEAAAILYGPQERQYIDGYAEKDLVGSGLWYLLFNEAHSVDPKLAGILEKMRDMGTLLEPNEEFGYVLRPVIDPNTFGGWATQYEYDNYKKCLEPHTKTLIWALGKIAGKTTTLDGFNPALKPSDDPRPDLNEDTFEWCQLLYMAYGVSWHLYEVLRFFRSQGTRLTRDLFHGYVMIPQIGASGHVWPNEKMYKDMRDKWLKPYEREIVDLLKRLAI